MIIITATGEEGREFVLSLGADEYFTQAVPTHRAAPNRRTGPGGTVRDLAGRVVTWASMFDTLTDRLDGIFKAALPREAPPQAGGCRAGRDLRVALLEADVAAEVADDLLARVRERALSEEVMKSLTPAQQVVKIVRDELRTRWVARRCRSPCRPRNPPS